VRQREWDEPSDSANSSSMPRRLQNSSERRKTAMREERYHSPVSKLSHCYGHLCLNDCVDTSNLVGYLPRTLKKQGLMDGSWHLGYASTL
jgi:hypothetical protein